MGGDPIESLASLIDALFLTLHNEEYDKIPILLEKLDKHLQNAEEDDLQRVYKALEQVEKTLQIKQNEIVSQLKDLGDLKKFKF